MESFLIQVGLLKGLALKHIYIFLFLIDKLIWHMCNKVVTNVRGMGGVSEEFSNTSRFISKFDTVNYVISRISSNISGNN